MYICISVCGKYSCSFIQIFISQGLAFKIVLIASYDLEKISFI